MNEASLRGLAAVALSLGGAACLAAALVPLDRTHPGPNAPGATLAAARQTYPADSLSQVVVAGNPFRLDRNPADATFDPDRSQEDAPQPSGPPRPPLRLVGLISGSPMAAIVDGFPGIEGGKVVRAGDTVGPLRITRLTASAVRIAGLDTTWILTMRP